MMACNFKENQMIELLSQDLITTNGRWRIDKEGQMSLLAYNGPVIGSLPDRVINLVMATKTLGNPLASPIYAAGIGKNGKELVMLTPEEIDEIKNFIAISANMFGVKVQVNIIEDIDTTVLGG